MVRTSIEAVTVGFRTRRNALRTVLLVVAVALFVPVHRTHGQLVLDANLLFNGDAEGQAGVNGTTNTLIPGWEDGLTRTVSGVSVTAGNINTEANTEIYAGNFSLSSTLGGGVRGSNYLFANESVNNVSVFQTIDVSSAAAAIDAGSRAFKLTGMFAGFFGTDTANLTISFLDGSGTVIATRALGDNNSSHTSMPQIERDGMVPASTRTIRADVNMIRTSGANEGAADNLDIRLNTPSDATINVASGTQTDSTVRSGYQRLIKTGAGTLILNAASSSFVGVRIDAGTLQLSASGRPGSSDVQVNAGGVFDVNGQILDGGAGNFTNYTHTVMNGGMLLASTGVSSIGGIQVTTNSTASIASASFLQILGPVRSFGGASLAISGAGGLNKSGGAIVILNGNSSYGGGTTISDGPRVSASGTTGNAAIVVRHANALGAGGVGIGAVTNLRALEFDLTAGAIVPNLIAIPTSTATQIGIQSANDASNYTLSGKVTGGYSGLTLFIDAGNAFSQAVMRLANTSNDFTATVNVNRGTVAITGDGAFGAAANQIRWNTDTNLAALRFDAPGINVAHPMQVLKDVGFDVFGDNDGNGVAETANAATISGTLTGASTATFSARGGVTTGGNSAGSLRLTGPNSFSSSISVAASTKLTAASTTALGTATGNTSVASGGTLALDSVGMYTNAEPLVLSGNGVQSGATGVGALQNVAGSNIFNGPITLSADASIGISAGALTLGGAIDDGANSFALTKLGPGLLSIGATASHHGSTNVSAGTLILTASGALPNSSGVDVAVGATFDISALVSGFSVPVGRGLADNGSVVGNVIVSGGISGTGSVSGSVMVANGGTLSPGNSVGGLNTGALTLAPGAALTLELQTTAIRDLVTVTGMVDVSGSTLNLSLLPSHTFALNSLTFILLNDASDAITGSFTGHPNGDEFLIGDQRFRISYFANSTTNASTGGNDIALMAVPEPNVILLGSAGFLLLALRRGGLAPLLTRGRHGSRLDGFRVIEPG